MKATILTSSVTQVVRVLVVSMLLDLASVLGSHAGLAQISGLGPCSLHTHNLGCSHSVLRKNAENSISQKRRGISVPGLLGTEERIYLGSVKRLCSGNKYISEDMSKALLTRREGHLSVSLLLSHRL